MMKMTDSFKASLHSISLLQVYTLIKLYTMWLECVNSRIFHSSPPTIGGLCEKIKELSQKLYGNKNKISYSDAGNFSQWILKPLKDVGLVYWKDILQEKDLPKGLCLPTPKTMEFIRELNKEGGGSNYGERFWDKIQNAFIKLDEICMRKSDQNCNRVSNTMANLKAFLEKVRRLESRGKDIDVVDYLYSTLLYFCDQGYFPAVENVEIDIAENAGENKLVLKVLKLHVNPSRMNSIGDRIDENEIKEKLKNMNVKVNLDCNNKVVEIRGRTWSEVMEVGRCLMEKKEKK